MKLCLGKNIYACGTAWLGRKD